MLFIPNSLTKKSPNLCFINRIEVRWFRALAMGIGDRGFSFFFNLKAKRIFNDTQVDEGQSDLDSTYTHCMRCFCFQNLYPAMSIMCYKESFTSVDRNHRSLATAVHNAVSVIVCLENPVVPRWSVWRGNQREGKNVMVLLHR